MKNSSYLPKSILLAIVALFINACDKNEIDVKYDIKGDWKVISFMDYETSVIIKKTEDITWMQFNNGDNTISFTESDNTIGIVSGTNVTNTFSGKYFTDSKGKIFFTDFVWTEMNEPEWGRLFHSIANAESYEIRNGQLMIFYDQRKNSIVFDKVKE